MKQLIFTFLAFFPIVAFGQFKSSVDLVGGVEFAYRTLNSEPTDGVPTGLIESTRERETAKVGFRFGFNYNQRVSKKIFLKSGLRIVNIGYSSGKITGLRWGSEINFTDGVFMIEPDPNLPHEVEFFYEYWFLEIPIVGRYEFNEKRFAPFIEVGISPHIYLDSRTKQKTDLGDSSYQNTQVGDNFNKIQLVGSVSFGFNYAATESLQLFGQPIFRYHLTKTVDSPIKEHLYNVGIEVGLRKRLK